MTLRVGDSGCKAVRAIPRGQVSLYGAIAKRAEGVEPTGGRIVSEASTSLDELLWKQV